MLFKKMLRDLKLNKVQFLSIFLMMFIGVFIYTGVNSEWQGMQTSVNNYYEKTNMADEWVYGNHFTKEDVNKILENENIEAVNRRMLLPVTIDQSKVDLYVLEENTVSKMLVVKGKKYDPTINGVWLDASFASENGYLINDSITFHYDSYSLEYPIVGLVKHPEYIFAPMEGEMIPNHSKYGYAFVSASTFPYASMIDYNQLVVRKSHDKVSVLDIMKRSNAMVVEREYLASNATIQSEIEQHQVFGGIFPIAFLMIAFLTTITTMSKMCMNQRLQIGILKALGFKSKTLLIHYLSHIGFISTLGVILGYLIGPLILPNFIFSMMVSLYDIPNLYASNNIKTIIVLILCLLVSYLITYLVCKKQIKMKPVDALNGKVQVKVKHIPFECTFLWKHFSFCTQWNLRDIYRNKLRSMITLLGILGCTSLLFCAFSLSDSMSELMTWNYEHIQKYDMKVDLNTVSNIDEINRIKLLMDGECIQESAVEVKLDKTKKASLTVLNSNEYQSIMKDMKQDIQMKDDGIYISYKLAKNMDVEKGDMIEWRNIGSEVWHTSKVNDIIRTPFSQGITMSQKHYVNNEEMFVPTSIVGKRIDLEEDQYSVIKSILNQTQMIKNTETMLEAMNVLIAILVLGAVILGVVVLYNLGSLSYFEKERDMATLKVLGFKTKDLKKILQQQNLWLTLVGILLGIPGGSILLRVMMATIGDTMDIIAVSLPLTYLICIVGTLILSLIVMAIVSKRLKNIDMVAALKAKE